MVGFGGEEVDAEIGGVSEGTNFKGVARGNTFWDGRNIAAIRGVKSKAFVVEPVDAVWVAQCAVEVVAGVVKARNEEVSQAIAFVGSTSCGYTAKTVDTLRSVAGSPVHVLVAEGHIAAVDDGVRAVGNDELKSIEFVAVKSVVADVYPIDINGCWGNFINHLTIAIAGIHVAPKRRHNSVAYGWKRSGRKRGHRTSKSKVSVVVDVDAVVGLAI